MSATVIVRAFSWSNQPDTDPVSAALRARDPDEPACEWDARLRQVVLAYRGDRSLGPPLLELLKPAMARWLSGLEPQPPVISSADLEQQIALEVLESASSIPLHPGSRFVDRAIVQRAGRCVSRWLDAEAVHRDWFEPLPEDDDEDEEADEE